MKKIFFLIYHNKGSDVKSAKKAMPEYAVRFAAEAKKRFPDAEVYAPYRHRSAWRKDNCRIEYYQAGDAEQNRIIEDEDFWKDPAESCLENVRKNSAWMSAERKGNELYAIYLIGKDSETFVITNITMSGIAAEAHSVPVRLFESCSEGAEAVYGDNPSDALDEMDGFQENFVRRRNSLLGRPMTGAIYGPSDCTGAGNIILIPGDGCISNGERLNGFADLVKNLYYGRMSDTAKIYVPFMVRNPEHRELVFYEANPSNFGRIRRSLKDMKRPPVSEFLDFVYHMEGILNPQNTAVVAVTSHGNPVKINRKEFLALESSELFKKSKRILVDSEDMRGIYLDRKIMHRITVESGNDVIFRRRKMSKDLDA